MGRRAERVSIAENLVRILARVSESAERVGRDPAEIKLVAVSKTVERDMIDAAYAAGVRHFAENRVQELKRKFEAPMPDDATVHLVGHLQTNKARDAVRYSQVVHSIDRLDVIDALQRRAALEGRRLDVLVQVNVAGEEQKFGCFPDEAPRLVAYAAEQENLRMAGLMTIAPLVVEAEETRPVFRALRELRDRIQEQYPDIALDELSMGMTNDYWVAIEEGATLIRLGRAVFQG
jgi:PLP dependent protein